MLSVFQTETVQEKPTPSPECGCAKVPKFLEGIKFKECMYGEHTAKMGDPRKIALAYAKFSLRLALLVLCVFCTLSGLFYVVIGILLTAVDGFEVTSREVFECSRGILFIGCVVIAASLAGFFGVYKSCIKWLVIFVAIFAALLPVGIIVTARSDYVFVVKDKQELQKSFKNYTNDPRFWDDIQKQFVCCGINGPEDWGEKIPETCCRLSKKLEGEAINPKCKGKNKYLNKKGCLGAVKGITRITKILLKIALVLAFFKIVPILLGVTFLIWLDFDKQRVKC